MTSPTREGIIVIAIVVMAYGVGAMFDALEWLYTWLRAAEPWEIDEFLVPFFVLLVGSVWFALRRLRDLRAEVIRRQDSEAAQRTTEEHFRNLIEGSVQGIVIDHHRKPIFVNQSFAEILGYDSPQEILAMASLDPCVAPHERPRLKHYTEARLKKETAPTQYEYEALRKDGSIATLQNVVRVITWEGQPAIQNTVIDISERKQAEKALRESETRLTLAQEAADIGTADWDVKSDRVHWSMHQFHLHGATPTEDKTLSLKDWRALVHPDDRVRSVDVINASVKSGEGFSVEYRIIWPDEQIRWLCGTARVIRDDNGRAVRMIGVSIDITERKRAEEALRESEERFVLAVQGSQDGLWYCPDVSDEDVEWWSSRWYELLGYKKDEIKASLTNFRALLHPDDRPRHIEMLRAHLEERAPFDIEYRLKTKSGQYRWYQCRAQAFWDERGKATKMAGSLRDITERKQVEDEMQQSRQRLRNLAIQLQAVREEERMIIAREVHDEMGQALTALKMDLAWVAKNLPKGWRTVPDRVRSMVSLTDSMLATVRQLSSRLRPAMLDDLGLEAAIEWQAQEFASRGNYGCGLELKATELRPDKKRDIVVFRILQEALTNVARHAAARQITVKLRTIDEALLLQVADDGKGITDDALASTYSLGLTGMYERARTLGGSLIIERGANGKGTVLKLRVPHTSTKRAVHA